MINDITALRADTRLAGLAADRGIPLVLMHSVGMPGEMRHEIRHQDVVATISQSLAESISAAEAEGVEDIIIDPGFGFGKSTADNLQLVASLGEFRSFGHPVMIGASRKATIGSVLATGPEPRPVEGRMYGSLAVAAAAVMNGASILRVHDVGPTRDVVDVLHALNASSRALQPVVEEGA